MFQHDSMFFIGVFVFIFFMWIVLGGPTHPISFSGPLLSGPEAIGGGTYLSFPRSPSLGNSGVNGSYAGGSSIPRSNTQSGLSYHDQQAVNTALETASFGAPSPYRGIVTLNSYVQSAAGASAQNENIQLYVSESATAPVSISGWKIESEVTGKGATLPKGTEVPRSGVINASESIVLEPGDRAYLISGRSPIGASFRENVCIGYFGEYQTFSPQLPDTCPLPNDELKNHYGPALVTDPTCADYVDRLSRCSVALSPPPGLSNSCQSFLTTYLNYNGCVQAHQNDYNFKGSTWRIYLGHDTTLWRQSRETIKLLDDAGKTVDMFTY